MNFERAYFELLQVQRMDAQHVLLRKLTAAPADAQDGLVAYADGSGWNPGNGPGPYFHNGTLWLPYWGAWNDGAGSGLDADLLDGHEWSEISFTKSFESSEQTLTGATVISVTHSLGAVPKLCQAVIRCKTAEFGYLVGNEAAPTNMFSTGIADNMSGDGLFANSTSVSFVVSPDGLILSNRTSGSIGQRAIITLANWKLILRAWV